MSSLFATFPVYIIQNLCYEWLEIDDWGCLDSALCCHNERNLLISMNYGGNNGIKIASFEWEDIDTEYVKTMLSWIESRKIYISELEVGLQFLLSHSLFDNDEFCSRVYSFKPFNFIRTCANEIQDDEADGIELERFKISFYGLTFIAINFPNLKSLDLSNCLALIDDKMLQLLLKSNNLLTKLCCGNITDSSLDYISNKCPLLQHLNLDCCNITNAGLLNLSNKLTNLKILLLNDCIDIAEDRILFNEWISNMKSLTKLKIPWWSQGLDISSAQLIKNILINLNSLLFNCKNINMYDILKEICPLHSISSLHLSNRSDDDIIIEILKKYKRWNELKIGSESYNNKHFNRLFGELSNITTLTISIKECSDGTKFSLRQLGSLNVFGNIIELQLRLLFMHSSNADSMITFICKKFMKIKILEIDSINLTNKGLGLISNSLKELRSFTISYNDRITYEGMIKFCVNMSHQLKNLTIDNCYKISTNDDSSWCDQFVGVDIVIRND
eukprot:gene4816-6747_t